MVTETQFVKALFSQPLASQDAQELQLAAIEAAMPVDQVAGSRYAEAQMAMLDSET